MSWRQLVTVGDLMVNELRSIDGLATVTGAMEMMRLHGVNSLVVNRRDDTDEVGANIAVRVTHCPVLMITDKSQHCLV